MVGVHPCQRSFYIAFAFLREETLQDYLWALDHLRSLYELYDTLSAAVYYLDDEKATEPKIYLSLNMTDLGK